MDVFTLTMVVLGLALTLVILALIAVVTYGRLVVRNQRRLLVALRRDGIAFVCRPTLGMQIMAGFVLAVDRDAVSLWKVGPRQPVRLQSFPRNGARVAPTQVKVNVLRTSPALSVVSAAGERIDVVIYPDPTGSRSAPVKDVVLDLVSEKIRASLAGTPT
ncbi:MAG TPA: hypothetical protein VGN37_04660 [Actinocatenispora sp.]